jgi:hypothetical protein
MHFGNFTDIKAISQLFWNFESTDSLEIPVMSSITGFQKSGGYSVAEVVALIEVRVNIIVRLILFVECR